MRGGWKLFLPFLKGWSRVIAAQRHLTEGAAGNTNLHWFVARREASIRRSRCDNSEAIVGEAVSANRQYTANKSVGHCRQYLVFFLLCPIRQTLIFVTRRKTLVVVYTYTLMWKKRYYFTATSERRRAGAEAVPNRKHFAKPAKPLRGRSDGTVT